MEYARAREIARRRLERALIIAANPGLADDTLALMAAKQVAPELERDVLEALPAKQLAPELARDVLEALGRRELVLMAQVILLEERESDDFLLYGDDERA
jgi:hypothetical protein